MRAAAIEPDAFPAELRRLLRAPECASADAPIAVSGRWLGIIGADGHTELDLVPPYDVRLQVEQSSSSRYERAQLTIRVPLEAGRPLDRDDIRESLSQQGTIAITARCAGGRFVAMTVRAVSHRSLTTAGRLGPLAPAAAYEVHGEGRAGANARGAADRRNRMRRHWCGDHG